LLPMATMPTQVLALLRVSAVAAAAVPARMAREEFVAPFWRAHDDRPSEWMRESHPHARLRRLGAANRSPTATRITAFTGPRKRPTNRIFATEISCPRRTVPTAVPVVVGFSRGVPWAIRLTARRATRRRSAGREGFAYRRPAVSSTPKKTTTRLSASLVLAGSPRASSAIRADSLR
jgi:hypothetical protein